MATNKRLQILSVVTTWVIVAAIIWKIVFVMIPQMPSPFHVRLSYVIAFGFFSLTVMYTTIQCIEVYRKWHWDRYSLLRRDGQREQREAHKADYLRLHWMKIAYLALFAVGLIAMNVIIGFMPPPT